MYGWIDLSLAEKLENYCRPHSEVNLLEIQRSSSLLDAPLNMQLRLSDRGSEEAANILLRALQFKL